MSIAVEPFARPSAVALSLRYALRELRGVMMQPFAEPDGL